MIAHLTALFPLWALLFSALAYLVPEPFVPLKPAIAWLLGLIMLGMGWVGARLAPGRTHAHQLSP